MSTALVYYAEHYVIDIVAGALLAWVVLVGASAWERRHSRGDRALLETTDPMHSGDQPREMSPTQ